MVYRFFIVPHQVLARRWDDVARPRRRSFNGRVSSRGRTPPLKVRYSHSVVVATFGQCWLVAIRPNNYTGVSGGAVFAVEQSLPLSVTAAGPGKPITGLGPDAVVYGNSEIPTVAWHHGKGWALLECSWDEEVVISKITAELPILEAAARQVYAHYG